LQKDSPVDAQGKVIISCLYLCNLSTEGLSLQLQSPVCQLLSFLLPHFLFLFSILTLSVPAEYMYSVASHASHPDGVLVLRNFHKVVKWPGMVDFKV
jgi:hypothetical protein